MSTPVICPHCEAGLRVPADPRAAVVICPRCQNRFPNPEQTGEAGTRVILAQELQASHATVGGDWHAASPLIIVGALAIAAGCMSALELKSWALAFALLGSLMWLGVISAGIMMWQTRDFPQARSPARVIINTLAFAGILFLVVVVLGIVCIIFQGTGF